MNDCKLLHTTEDIKMILANYKLINVATDGSHDPKTGKMAIGWVIAVGEYIIAQGKGPAEGHPTLSTAFRSEAYGLLVAAQFIQHLISTFQMTRDRYKWFFHINNKAVIDRMLVYDASTITGKSTQWPDADITITTNYKLHKLKAQYLHVKSHQDKYNDTTKLNFPARMNKIADELAWHQCGTMKAPRNHVTGKFLCLLRIDERHITRDLQKWIMDTSSQIPIRQYLRERHGWNRTVFDIITWDLQYKKTLATFDNNAQQRILKFVHDWLPTNHRMHREKLSTTQRCPLCHYQIEDNWHLLQCRYPKQMQTITELIEKRCEHGEQTQLGELIASAVPEYILNRTWQADTVQFRFNTGHPRPE
jgi:hypothetical protein